MLREYEWNGSTWQFDEKDAPEGARPVERKAAKPANKARRPANKEAAPRANKGA